MFDKTIIQNTKKEYVPYEKEVNIKIGRAPTDESIELLKEFEEKAMMKLIHYSEIKSNELTLGKLHIFRMADHVNKLMYNINFYLNGKEFNIRNEFTPSSIFKNDVQKILIEFYKSISNIISEKLLHENFFQIANNFNM